MGKGSARLTIALAKHFSKSLKACASDLMSVRNCLELDNFN